MSVVPLAGCSKISRRLSGEISLGAKPTRLKRSIAGSSSLPLERAMVRVSFIPAPLHDGPALPDQRAWRPDARSRDPVDRSVKGYVRLLPLGMYGQIRH